MSATRFTALVVLLLASACTTRGPGGTPRPRFTASPPDLSWSHAAPLPTPRTEITAAALDGLVYVGGGLLPNGDATSEVDVYNPGVDKWLRSVPFPEALHHTALVATGGRLYVIGGYRADGSASAKVWSRSPDDNTWQPEPPMRTARGAFATAVDAGGRIHVIGGASRFEPLGALVSAHEVYDPRQGFWRTLAPLPEGRDHLTAAAVGNTIVVIGGRDLSYTRNKSRVDIFDAGGRGAWRRGPDLRKARGGIASAAVGSVVVVFGGEDPSGTFPSVEYLDVRHGGWMEGPALPTARHGLGAAAVGDRVYVVGGGPRPGISATGANEVLTLK